MPEKDRIKELEFLMKGAVAGLDHKLGTLKDRVDANANTDIELRRQIAELKDGYARLDERTQMLKDHTGQHKAGTAMELARLKGKDEAESEAKKDTRERRKTNVALVASTFTFLGLVIQLLIKLIGGE